MLTVRRFNGGSSAGSAATKAAQQSCTVPNADSRPGEYKTTNHRENPNCSRSRLGIVLKKLVLPSAEEFQQGVEERTETDNLSIAVLGNLVEIRNFATPIRRAS